MCQIRIGKAGGVKHSQSRIGSVFSSVIFLIITPPSLLDLKEKQAKITHDHRDDGSGQERAERTDYFPELVLTFRNHTSASHRRLQHLITLKKQPAQ